MAVFETVQPGDVITSEFMNTLLLKLEDLEERLSELEGGVDPNALLISSFDPASSQHIGQPMWILGQNFSENLASNVITVDGVLVDSGSLFSSSGPTALGFNVPEVTGVDDDGKVIVVKVVSGSSTDERTYIVKPALANEVAITTVGGAATGDPLNLPNVLLGVSTTLEGSGFSDQASDLDVRLSTTGGTEPVEVVGTVDSSSTSRITVTFPSGAAGVTGGPADLTVMVGGAATATVSINLIVL